MPPTGLRVIRFAVLAAFLVASASARAADEDPLARAPALLAQAVPHVQKAAGAEFEVAPRVEILGMHEAVKVGATDLRPHLARKYARLPEEHFERLLEIQSRASVLSSVARYSISRKTIVLVREAFEGQFEKTGFAAHLAQPLLQAVLAHECVHALDDQRFDLGAYYAGATDDEGLRARAMFVEGRAVVLGRRAAGALGLPAEVKDLLPGGKDPATTSAWQARLTYSLGADFVEHLEESEEAERPFEKPPTRTHVVCQPERWANGKLDERPRDLLARAGIASSAALSELQLRARYASLHGAAVAEQVFASFRGGAQALVEGTNVAALAFEDDASARRYADLSGDESTTHVLGLLVLRTAGPDPKSVLDALVRQLAQDAESK